MPIDGDVEENATLALSNRNENDSINTTDAISRLQQEARQANMAFAGNRIKDITETFTIAANQLKPGQLVKDDYFTLFEAVGALEIMDPKMDSGYIPPDDDFLPDFDPAAAREASEVLWIMDQLLCLEIIWLEGYPLSQTIFTSLHIDRLLSPDQKRHDLFHPASQPRTLLTEQDHVIHTVLRAYCIGLVKCCQLASHLIQSQTYYEEEDFVTHLFGRELLPTVGSNAAVDLLKEAIRWLSEANLNEDVRQALVRRCSFRLDLVQTLAGDAREWEGLITRLDAIEKSHSLAEELPSAFSEKVQRRLATSTPPRPMIQISFDEAHDKWTKLCQELMSVYQLTTFETIQDPHTLLRAVWAFAYRTEPGALARAQMQELLFADNAVRGQVSHFDLMLNDMKDLVLAGDPIAEPESFAVEVPTDPRHIACNILRDFMERAIDEFLNLYRMVCQNRARIRRTFTQAIAMWDAIQKEAYNVDNALRRARSSVMSNPAYSRNNGPIVSWARYHSSCILAWTIQLGFETGIYLPDEASKMYWYLSSFCAYRRQVLETMQDALRKRKEKSPNSRRTMECDFSITFLMSLTEASNATESLASALWKLYHILTKEGIIKTPARSFSKPRLLHEARMKCFMSMEPGGIIDDMPPARAYESEIARLAPSLFEHFDLACKAIDDDIKAAKVALAALKKYAPEQARYVGTETEWKKEIKQLETSCVAVAVSLSQLKRLREKHCRSNEGLGGAVECTLEKKYHEWWVIPQLKEKMER